MLAGCLMLGLADLAVLNLVVVPRLYAARSTSEPPSAVARLPASGPSVERSPQEITPAGMGAAASPTPAAATADPPLPENLRFFSGSARLSRPALNTLRAIIAVLERNPTRSLVLRGHADERGISKYNEALGQQRANGAARWLRTHGIPAHRLHPISLGSSQPLDASRTPEAQARNRRVEFAWE